MMVWLLSKQHCHTVSCRCKPKTQCRQGTFVNHRFASLVFSRVSEFCCALTSSALLSCCRCRLFINIKSNFKAVCTSGRRKTRQRKQLPELSTKRLIWQGAPAPPLRQARRAGQQVYADMHRRARRGAPVKSCTSVGPRTPDAARPPRGAGAPCAGHAATEVRRPRPRGRFRPAENVPARA